MNRAFSSRLARGFIRALLLLSFCAAAPPSTASLVLISRETFQDVGTLGGSTPGNLGAVNAGLFYKRASGPRLTADATASSSGWSSDLRAAINDTVRFHTMTIPTSGTPSPANQGAFSCWYFLATVPVVGTNTCALNAIQDVNGNSQMQVVLNPVKGTFQVTKGSYSLVETEIAYPTQQWFELRYTWHLSGTNWTYDYSIAFRTAGSNDWTQLFQGTASTNNQLKKVVSGLKNGGNSSSYFVGRYGLPALYASTSYPGDANSPLSDVIDPSNAPRIWYVDPANGNDQNDGVSPATAWRTVGKINVESQFCGLFPSTSGYQKGDVLQIETTARNLLLGLSSLNLNTRGLNVVQLGGGGAGMGELQAWTAVDGGAWSGPIPGTSNVYKTTLSEANPCCVLWENDLWLNHCTGDSLSAVQASLQALPGSFWTDGTTMYCHPFGDTNPANDGKVYTRSYNRDGTSAVMLLAPDLHLKGLRVRKTCLADKVSNDPASAYCYQTLGAGGGEGLIEDCYGDYGSKHVFGFTDDDLARQTTVVNCRAEQGSPYSSQTPWVDYSSLSAAGSASTTYVDCRTDYTTGRVGSLTGKTYPDGAWLCHNNGSAQFQFARISFTNCRWNGKVDTYGAVQTVRWIGGSFAGGIPRSPDVSFDQALITGTGPTNDALGGMVKVSNSIVKDVSINGGFEPPAQGTIDYENCTIDLRNAVSNNYYIALFKRNASPATLNFIWRNNIVLGSAQFGFGVLRGASSGDPLTFDHNAYQNVAIISFDYNDGNSSSNRTPAQWQALGKDSGSILGDNLALLNDLSLSPVSPVIDLGLGVGPAADFTGVLFPVRNDIGAFEYPLPVIRTNPVSVQALEGATINFSARLAGNGPFTYQWWRNGAPLAGATNATLVLNAALPGQSGQYALTVTNARGAVTSAAATVTITAATFAAWQSAHFSPAQTMDPAVGASNADPNQNGLNNLLEYAFGGDPVAISSGGASIAPIASLVGETGAGQPAITFRRLFNAPNVGYSVGVSSDLVNWDESTALTSLVGAPQPTGDGRTELVTLALAPPTGLLPGAPKFLRVRVTDGSAPQGAVIQLPGFAPAPAPKHRPRA